MNKNTKAKRKAGAFGDALYDLKNRKNNVKTYGKKQKEQR